MSQSRGIWIAAAVASLCLLIGAAVTIHISGLVQDVVASQHQQRALAKLSETRTRLESRIESAMSLGNGLRSYVIQMELDQDGFAKFGRELISEMPYVRSLGLAPQNILQFLYPLEGNEKAIGLNYRSNASQWPSIEEAIRTRASVVDGPVPLVQGGQALMLRVPVFLPKFPGQPAEQREYWGVVTLVIDEMAMIAAAGLQEEAEGYRFAIMSKKEAEGSVDMVFGNQDLRHAEAVSLPLDLSGTTRWEILAYPVGGWITYSHEVLMSRVIGTVVSLIIAALAFLLVHEVFKVHAMALHDPLTGLANRRLLEDRMQQLAAMSTRNGNGFDIYYVDLNAFKPINDNHGHGAGDEVLIEVGQRLQTQTRQTDTVARVGGDEFIVLTPGTMTDDERQRFVQRVSKNVCADVQYSGSKIEVSASIGFASFPQDANSVEDLLRIADTRMYTQKFKRVQTPISATVPDPVG